VDTCLFDKVRGVLQPGRLSVWANYRYQMNAAEYEDFVKSDMASRWASIPNQLTHILECKQRPEIPWQNPSCAAPSHTADDSVALTVGTAAAMRIPPKAIWLQDVPGWVAQPLLS